LKTNRKEAEKKLKKEYILKTLEPLFFEKDVDSITMEEMAKYCEYTRKSLYNYFSGKEEIYFNITLAIFRRTNKYMNELYETLKSESYIDYFKNMITCMIMLYKNYPKEYKLLSHFHSNFDNISLQNELFLEFENETQMFIVVKVCRELYNSGKITQKYPLPLLTIFINGSINGIIDMLEKKKEVYSLQSMVDENDRIDIAEKFLIDLYLKNEIFKLEK